MTLVLRVAAKLLRSPAMRWPALLSFVAGAVVVGMFCALQALAVGGPAIAASTLGRFDVRLDVDLPADPGADPTERLAPLISALTASGARNVTALVGSYDVGTHPDTVTRYLEAPWVEDPFPGRFTLRAGRLPRAPGEVAVTESVSRLGTDVVDRSIAVFNGQAQLVVVGLVRDESARRAGRILAAPGTWAAVVDEDVLAKDVGVSASTTVLWQSVDGAAERSAATTALAEVLAEGQAMDEQARQAAREAIQAGLAERSRVVEAAPDGPLERNPLGYLVPSVLLPSLALAAAQATSARRLRRYAATFRSVGMRARAAVWACLLATTAACLVAALVGSVTGALLAVAARPGLESLRGADLSPYRVPGSAILRVLTVTVLAAVAIGLFETARGRRSTVVVSLQAPHRRVARSLGARLAATAAALATGWLAATMYEPAEAMFMVVPLVVLVAVVAPGVLRMVVSGVPARRAVGRFVGRRLRRDLSGAAAVALTATTLGAAMATLILLHTVRATDAANLISPVPHGQVVIFGHDGAPPAVLVRQSQALAGPGAAAVQLWATYTQRQQAAVAATGRGSVRVVQTPQDAQRLCEGRLTKADLDLLSAGGFLTFTDDPAKAPTDRRAALHVIEIATSTVRRTPQLTTRVADCGRSWAATTGAVTLRSTAATHTVPLGGYDLVLTGLSGATAERIVDGGRRLGYGTELIDSYRPLTPAPIPLGVIVTLIGACAAGIGSVVALARAQSTALRRYAAGLVALGVPVHWARAALRREIALVAGVGALLAAPIAVLPLGIAALRFPAIVIDVPWLEVLGLLGLAAAALVVGVASATLRLSAAERAGAG